MSLLELVNSRKRRQERPPHQQNTGHMSERASGLALISSQGSTAASGAISHISPMPHEHEAFLHPIQLPRCRSIALRRKFRAFEGPAGGRRRWRLTSPASFHPSSFQSVSQTMDASLLAPSLSSRTSEHCEGPQTTLLGATSSTPPASPSSRARARHSFAAAATGASSATPPHCSKDWGRDPATAQWPRSQGHRVRTSRSAGDGLLQISHQRLVEYGIGIGSCLRAAGFQLPQTSSPMASLALQPPHDAYQSAVLTTSA